MSYRSLLLHTAGWHNSSMKSNDTTKDLWPRVTKPSGSLIWKLIKDKENQCLFCAVLFRGWGGFLFVCFSLVSSLFVCLTVSVWSTTLWNWAFSPAPHSPPHSPDHPTKTPGVYMSTNPPVSFMYIQLYDWSNKVELSSAAALYKNL